SGVRVVVHPARKRLRVVLGKGDSARAAELEKRVGTKAPVEVLVEEDLGAVAKNRHGRLSPWQTFASSAIMAPFRSREDPMRLCAHPLDASLGALLAHDADT